MEKEEKKQTCDRCGSGEVYIRIKDRTVVCRKCGNISPLEDE